MSETNAYADWLHMQRTLFGEGFPQDSTDELEALVDALMGLMA
jgi:hypothetical protein